MTDANILLINPIGAQGPQGPQGVPGDLSPEGMAASEAAIASAAAAATSQGAAATSASNAATSETNAANSAASAANSASNASTYDPTRRFATVALLLASNRAAGGAGTIWQAESFLYREAAAGATDHHVTTAGGVKLYVIAAPDGFVSLEQLALSATGGVTASAISSGLLTRLDFDYTDASAVRAFSAPGFPATRGLRVNGVDWSSEDQAGALAALPTGFPAPQILTAQFVNFGVVATDYDVAGVYDPRIVYPASSIKTYYIDPINGTSGGAGTEADPMDRPSRATALEAATPSAQPALLLICRAGKWDQSGTPFAFPAGLTKPYGIVPWVRGQGRIKFLQGWWGNSRTWTNAGGGQWTASVTSCSSVFDEAYNNDVGDAVFYTRVFAVGDLVPGAWMQDGGTLRIMTLDGRQPDINIGIGREIQNNISDGLRSQSIYAEGVDFLGGQTGTRMRTSVAFNVDFITKSCRWMYSSGNGMEVYGHRLAIHQNGVAAYNLLDGYNYHSDSATLTREGVGIEINCRGYRNGYSWSGSTNINNGSTAHDETIMMRYGGVYFENQGPNIADVNAVYSYNFGVVARDSRRAKPHPDCADFNFSDSGNPNGVEAWIDCCFAPSGTSNYALCAGAGVRVKRSLLHPSVFGVGNVSGW